MENYKSWALEDTIYYKVTVEDVHERLIESR